MVSGLVKNKCLIVAKIDASFVGMTSNSNKVELKQYCRTKFPLLVMLKHEASVNYIHSDSFFIIMTSCGAFFQQHYNI